MELFFELVLDIDHPRRPLRRLRHAALAAQPQELPQAVRAAHRQQEPAAAHAGAGISIEQVRHLRRLR